MAAVLRDSLIQVAVSLRGMISLHVLALLSRVHVSYVILCCPSSVWSSLDNIQQGIETADRSVAVGMSVIIRRESS